MNTETVKTIAAAVASALAVQGGNCGMIEVRRSELTTGMEALIHTHTATTKALLDDLEECERGGGDGG